MKHALIDADAYPLVAEYDWRYVSGLLQYAYAVGRHWLGMHRVVMQAPATHIVHHHNGDGLDNRRENLAALTPAEHRSEHWKIFRRQPESVWYLGEDHPRDIAALVDAAPKQTCRETDKRADELPSPMSTYAAAYRKGWEARTAGLSREHNPYPARDANDPLKHSLSWPFRRYWISGWEDAGTARLSTKRRAVQEG